MHCYRLFCEAEVVRSFNIQCSNLLKATNLPLQALPGLYSISIFIIYQARDIIGQFNCNKSVESIGWRLVWRITVFYLTASTASLLEQWGSLNITVLVLFENREFHQKKYFLVNTIRCVRPGAYRILSNMQGTDIQVPCMQSEQIYIVLSFC